MACCVPGSEMGNQNEVSLETIWHSDAYNRLRARVNTDNPPELCRKCPYKSSKQPSTVRDMLTPTMALYDDLMGEPPKASLPSQELELPMRHEARSPVAAIAQVATPSSN